MPDVTTIDEVLDELDVIVDTTLRENSPLGIFAWVYRRTTAEVAKGIREDWFEDGNRMEQFDVAFARMYIDAFYAYRKQESVSSAWKFAFDAANNHTDKPQPIILQHLLLGMNAHINLDLGIAAAETAPGNQIELLKSDFMTINNLLQALIEEIQKRISRVSPLLFLLDLIGKRSDEEMVNWSIRRARGFAWNLARRLADANNREKEEIIEQADHHITDLADCVAYPPGFVLPTALSVIRYFEEQDTGVVIKKLRK